MTELERRVAAVTATAKHFAGRPFAFGRTDCAKLVVWHLRQMGHRSMGIAKGGTYQSALGARRALARAGFENLAQALSARLPEIAPAAALPGDIVTQPGTDGWEAMGVVMGNGVILGFTEAAEEGTQPIRLAHSSDTRAWRA